MPRDMGGPDRPGWQGRERAGFSVRDPKIRKAALELIEAIHPGTDDIMRTVRATLINAETAEDREAAVHYVGVAIGILMRVVKDSPDALEIVNKYKAVFERADQD